MTVRPESIDGWLRVPAGLGVISAALLIAELIAIGTGLSASVDGYVVGVVTSAPFVGVLLYRRSRPSASGLDPEGEGRTLR
jgi:hypothetical protein